MRGECTYLNKDLAYFIEEGERYIFFESNWFSKCAENCFWLLRDFIWNQISVNDTVQINLRLNCIINLMSKNLRLLINVSCCRKITKKYFQTFYCNQSCRIKFWLHQNLGYMFTVNQQCILLKHTQIAYYLDVKRTVILYMKYILVTFWCQKACEMLIDYTKFNLKYYHIYTESLLLILKTFINKYPKLWYQFIRIVWA